MSRASTARIRSEPASVRLSPWNRVANVETIAGAFDARKSDQAGEDSASRRSVIASAILLVRFIMLKLATIGDARRGKWFKYSNAIVGNRQKLSSLVMQMSNVQQFRRECSGAFTLNFSPVVRLQKVLHRQGCGTAPPAEPIRSVLLDGNARIEGLVTTTPSLSIPANSIATKISPAITRLPIAPCFHTTPLFRLLWVSSFSHPSSCEHPLQAPT